MHVVYLWLYVYDLYETKLIKIPARMERDSHMYSCIANDSKASSCPTFQTSNSLVVTISHARGLVSWSSQQETKEQLEQDSQCFLTSLCWCHVSPQRQYVCMHSLHLSVGSFPWQLRSIPFIGSTNQITSLPQLVLTPEDMVERHMHQPPHSMVSWSRGPQWQLVFLSCLPPSCYCFLG